MTVRSGATFDMLRSGCITPLASYALQEGHRPEILGVHIFATCKRRIAPPAPTLITSFAIFRKDTGEILGVHIFGLHAADLIHEASNAVATGQTVTDIKFNVHAHPTLSEVCASPVRSVSSLSRRQPFVLSPTATGRQSRTSSSTCTRTPPCPRCSSSSFRLFKLAMLLSRCGAEQWLQYRRGAESTCGLAHAAAFPRGCLPVMF